MKKNIFSLLCTILVLTCMFPITTSFASNDNSYNLPEDPDDGVMLHAFMWPFKDIEANLEAIASAGYNSIQVSPIQRTKEDTGHWWLLYQPCSFSTIGNYQLGSHQDFIDLCSAADDYGIKIIVDAVLNHVADNGNDGEWADAIDDSLKNSQLYHGRSATQNYSDREDLVLGNMGGLPDLDTSRTDIQELHINFLNMCIEAGADGFRFDGAKHIETDFGLDAGEYWASNYWNHVLGNLNNRDDLYLVGEVLPDSAADNLEAYRTFLDITAHGYGETIRNAVSSKNLTGVLNIYHDQATLAPTEALVYVENHDNYQHGESTYLGSWERKMAFCILAARADMTARFFDRPGEELWNDNEIATVNHFSNAMVGQNEYLRFPRNETIMIDRGTVGLTIVNTGDSFYLNSATNLADGTYTNKTDDNSTFTVSNGTITGTVPGGKVVVLYDGSSIITPPPEQKAVRGEEITIAYDSSSTVLSGSNSITLHYGYDDWNDVEDLVMTNVGGNNWEVTFVVSETAESSLDYCFTNGSSWDNNNGSDWHLEVVDGSGSGTGGGTNEYTKLDDSVSYLYDSESSSLKIRYNSSQSGLAGSSQMIAHLGYNTWTNVDDYDMTNVSTNLWELEYSIPSSDVTQINVCFTNGSSWDNNNSNDWCIEIDGGGTGGTTNNYTTLDSFVSYLYDSESNSITIRYNSSQSSLAGSSQIIAHLGYNTWTNVDDYDMTKVSTDLWELEYSLPSSGVTQIDFCFTNGSSWDNNNSNNWTIVK